MKRPGRAGEVAAWIGRAARFLRDDRRPYLAALGACGIAFVALKLWFPWNVHGSYIDEYLHICGGVRLFEIGRFPDFYHGQDGYLRGAYVTVLVGALLTAFGKSLFVAKLLPAALGVVNFALALRLAHRVIADRRYVLLFVAVYAISPWVVFNHLYVRFYVFYELFLLLALTLLDWALAALRLGRWRRLGLALVALGGLDALVMLTSHDQGAHLLVVASLVGLAYLFVVECGGVAVPGGTLAGRLVGRVCGGHPLVRAAIVGVLVGGAALVLPVGELIGKLRHMQLTSTSSFQLGYPAFFLGQNVVATVLFALSALSVPLLGEGRRRLPVVVATALLALHLLASEDLQVTRALLYFLPLFYIVAFVAVSRIGPPAGHLIFACAALLLVSATVDAYPRSFWERPRIPGEIRYTNYHGLYGAVQEHCGDALIVDASPSAFIAGFYGVELDYVLTSKQHARQSAMFVRDKRSRRYYAMFDRTPVIVDWRELAGKGRDICLIMRDGSARRNVPGRAHQRIKKGARSWRFAGTRLYYIAAGEPPGGGAPKPRAPSGSDAAGAARRPAPPAAAVR